ncbi:MAG: CHAT domain-containing protein [Cyanobacteria bacterium J06639_14]
MHRLIRFNIKSKVCRFIAWMMATVLLVVHIQPALSQTIAVSIQPQHVGNIYPPAGAQSSRPAATPVIASEPIGDIEQRVEAARQAYEMGDYDSAVKSLEAAIALFDETSGFAVEQAIILGNLSLVYQQLDDWEGAITASEASLKLLGVNIRSDPWEEPLDQVLVQALNQAGAHHEVLASTLDIYGRLIFSQGNPEDALVSWFYAGQIHDRLAQGATNSEPFNRHRKQAIINGLNQVQALQTLGRNLQSCGILKTTLDLEMAETLRAATPTLDGSPTLLDCENQGGDSFINAEPDIEALRQHIANNIIDAYQLNEAEQTSVWQKLGEVLRVLGRLDDSRAILEEGLEIALGLPDQEGPLALLKEGRFINPNAKPEVVGQQPLSQLVPLYLSLGNTLTALGHLERDRKNSQYVDPKSISGNFGCFYPSGTAQGEEAASDTVAEYYQRAEFCYRDAIQRAQFDDRFALLKLQAQLNQLNLAIAYLQWLIEDIPTLTDVGADNLASDAVNASNSGQLDIRDAIAKQDKGVRSRINQLGALANQIEQIPLNSARVYARLNLAQNLLKYVTLQANNPDAGIALSRLLPEPIQIVKCLEKHPEVDLGACQIGRSLLTNPPEGSPASETFTNPEEASQSANLEASTESAPAVVDPEAVADPEVAVDPEDLTASEASDASETSEHLTELEELAELEDLAEAENLTASLGQALWSDIAYLLQTAVSESVELSSRIERVTPGNHQSQDTPWEDIPAVTSSSETQLPSREGLLSSDRSSTPSGNPLSPWEARVLGGRRLESLAWGNFGRLHEVLAQLYRTSLTEPVEADLTELAEDALNEPVEDAPNPKSLKQASPVYSEAQVTAVDRTIELLTKIARENTLTALKLAQPDKAPDVAYLWQWQLGRLLAQQGAENYENYQNAIDAYKIAVDTLDKARKNLSTIDSEVQFSFRDNVEPVYRELIDLLLQPEPGAEKPSQANLEDAIAEVGELQLAELENFLRCNVPNLTPVEEIQDSNAAIIHTILSDDTLNIVMKLPKQKELSFYPVSVTKQEVEITVEKLFQLLSEEEVYDARQEANKVYEWLIEPIREDLDKAFPLITESKNNSDPNLSRGTLVFVMDSILRKTPISYLKQDDRYLIEDYAIALAPRQEVFRPSVSRVPLSVFVGGIGLPQKDIEGEDFRSIDFLIDEFQAISQAGISTSDPLLDEDFTFDNIRTELSEGSYSAIHLKTHSQFSSNPNKTFIAAYKELIKANDLRNLIQVASEIRGEPLNLLVLSACSSAQGDDRAILGLAGIATLTGTRSTVSALWPAFDKFNTEFMRAFYSELAQGNITKAEALRRTQLQFTAESRLAPFWSNYVLVGNWL